MSDFLIDFGRNSLESESRILEFMKYYEDIKVNVFRYKKFAVFLSRSDDWSVWGPYISEVDNIFIAISGRIVLENWEWDRAMNLDEGGGLACKAIYTMYKSKGIDGLKNLNGNFVIMVFDGRDQKFYIINDRCGVFPCFRGKLYDNELVFSSHPDVLAKVLGIFEDLDVTSLAEFLTTGKVSFPYSYYRKIEALDYGYIHSINLQEDIAVFKSSERYFNFDFKIETKLNECELAEELAVAFKRAVNKRINPLFGQSAIALSGGLDSRTILCSVMNKNEIKAFHLFDEENFEYNIARDIARKVGVEFIPIKREPQYYWGNAEMCVKISGGMGNIIFNHYMGARKTLHQLGIRNVITGLYCDVLFKGLYIDTRLNKLTRTKSLSEFQYEYDEQIFWNATPHSRDVIDRINEVFPNKFQHDNSDVGKLNVERRRVFPLSYDSGFPENIIPQRVMGWYLPAIDNDILDIYLKTPPDFKVNGTMFSKMVVTQCGEEISKIVNANTGTRVDASGVRLVLSRYRRSFERRYKRLFEGLSSDGSWPEWKDNFHGNNDIELLWERKNSSATEVLALILGRDPFEKKIHEYRGVQLKLFTRLLTLKLWLEQRSISF